MAEDIIAPWKPEYDDYLRDESRCIGKADSISFPLSEAEVIDVLKEARSQGVSVTVQGARTGIVAGAVPSGGCVLNLSRMNKISGINRDEQTGNYSLIVQPGTLLSEVCNAVEKEGLFFPPDPTETSASIGGMVACNASGAMSFFYGSTRGWVESIGMVLSDGSVIRLRRGEILAQGRSFSITTDSGLVIAGSLPSYTQPNVKSAAGYYVRDDMDLIDLFIGMEGTLGVVTEIELRLIPKPQAVNGLTVFLQGEEEALKFVRILRGEAVDGFEPIAVRPVAVEFFNSKALDLLRKMKSQYPAFEKIPALRAHYHTAVYTEFHGKSDDALEEAIMQVMEVLTGLGVSDDDTWYATNDRELEPLKAFRHATPEAVNLLIDERKRACPELTKLGTDMSVPDEHMETIMAAYDAGLRENGLESVIFGHIGNNHVHVNILPHNMEEYERGKALYLTWARQVVELGGSVSAEHGIGKIKVPFLKMMYGEEVINEMRALRVLFDPSMMLNRGNLF